MRLFHASQLLILSQRDGSLSEPHIPSVDIILCQLLPPHHLAEVQQTVANGDVSLLCAFRHVGGGDVRLYPIYHRRLVFVIISSRRDCPDAILDVCYVNRALLFQAFVHLALYKSHEGSQPFIQDVGIAAGFVIADSVANQSIFSNAHTCINIVRFSIDGDSNLYWTFITLLGPVPMVIYK
jgi:hypothetical protein